MSSTSPAAWGQLQKQGSQLMVRSYELGVLLVPSLEGAYRASRWRGFSCTSSQPWQQQQVAALPPGGAAAEQAGPSAAAGAAAAGPTVRFVHWQRGASQNAEAAARGQELRVPLPIPYTLPPQRYAAGDQPWAVDTAWPGADSLGRTVDNPWGRLYGMLEQQAWAGSD